MDRVNPVAVEGTRTIPVYITIDNPEGLLRGGMFATGQIVVKPSRPMRWPCPRARLREDAEGDIRAQGARTAPWCAR